MIKCGDAADWLSVMPEESVQLEGEFSAGTSLIEVVRGLLLERDRLREALEKCLAVWEENNLQEHVLGGSYIDDIIAVALSATPEPPAVAQVVEIPMEGEDNV